MTLKKFIVGLIFITIILITFLGSLITILVSNYKIPQAALFRNTELYDSGFNQQAYDGMLSYGELTDNTVAESEVPPSNGISNVTADKLYANGTQTIIANSYLYYEWITGYYPKLNSVVYDETTNPEADLSKNEYIIFVDDDATYVDSNSAVEPSPNVISMTFQAEEATFMAGLISCMYVVTQYPNDPEEWTLGIWGGMDYPAVNAIMSGYEAGIQFFNEYVLGWDNDVNKIDNTIKLINYQGNTNYETINNAQKRAYWYSGSFDMNETGKAQALGLIEKGAKVITPVAGSQTINAINEAEIANNNSKDEIKVVGMDVDGKKQFPNNEEIFLTSAVKNIEDTVFINLLEIEAKNHPQKAANKINDNDKLFADKELEESDIKGVPFQEMWGYETDIPNPNNLSETLHGVGISNPEENQGLYEEFLLWASYSDYVGDEAKEKIPNSIEETNIVDALEFALAIMKEDYDGTVPNNSVSFTNNGTGESYYEWQ